MTTGILIPTFNRRHLLEASLASALRQTHGPLEVIVIDNGSSDTTREFLSRVQDPRVRSIFNPQNIGMMASINRGLDAFTTAVTWCTILPDDDILHEDFVHAMICARDRDPDVTVIHGARTLIDIRGAAILNLPPPPDRESAFDFLAARSCFRRDTYLTGTFFSRSAIKAIGGYPSFTTGTATDDALLFALAISGGLLYNGGARSYIRIHGEAESLNSRDAVKHLQAIEDFRRYVIDKAGVSGKFTARDLDRIHAVLLDYAKSINTSLWVRSVRSIKRSAREDAGAELRSLYETAASGRFPFTSRVPASLFFVRTLGWWMEPFFPYWLLWEVLDAFRKGFRRKWQALRITRAAATAEHRQAGRG